MPIARQRLRRGGFEVERPALAVGAFYPGVEVGEVFDFHVGAVPFDFFALAGFHGEVAEEGEFG